MITHSQILQELNDLAEISGYHIAVLYFDDGSLREIKYFDILHITVKLTVTQLLENGDNVLESLSAFNKMKFLQILLHLMHNRMVCEIFSFITIRQWELLKSKSDTSILKLFVQKKYKYVWCRNSKNVVKCQKAFRISLRRLYGTE